MLVDSNYGLVIDNFNTILNNYIDQLLPIFPDANNPDSPSYMLIYQCAQADLKNQMAMQILWNCINSNTAQGLGLDILSDTILNLLRKGLVPSVCVVDVTIAGLTSVLIVQVNVTVSSPQIIPIAWTVTGTATPSPAYKTTASFPIPSSGVYNIPVYSHDTVTPIPIADITGHDAVSGITFNSITNPAASQLGSIKIPSSWFVTTDFQNSPRYSPNQNYTYTLDGTYEIIVYSGDISTDLSIGQLKNPSSTFNSLITNVTNLQANILGTPIETDAQFQARRRYYLNIEGSTYYGLEKAINNLRVPALRSVFCPEVITDSFAASSLVIQLTVTGATSDVPVVIPFGWQANTTTSTTYPYLTTRAFSFTTDGTKYIEVFSSDTTTIIPIGDVTGGDVVTGVSGVGNITPSIEGSITLGQRGYRVYLDYPTLDSGFFNTSDLYLQLIAFTAYAYKTLGINLYGGVSGSTAFEVKLPYVVDGSFTTTVYLNPMQYTRISVNLDFYYTTDPNAAGFSGQVFDVSILPTLKQSLLDQINAYFQSKTLPTDLTYSINELSSLIQSTYTGIISLSGFTFGRPLVPSTGLQFLTRDAGELFNVVIGDFTLTTHNVA